MNIHVTFYGMDINTDIYYSRIMDPDMLPDGCMDQAVVQTTCMHIAWTLVVAWTTDINLEPNYS